MAQRTVLVGADQCRQFLKGLLPKGDNRELWIKFGHDSFYRAEWDENGNLSGIATSLADKGDPYSREIKGRPIPDLIKHLELRAKKEDGGVFYIPTQPTGYPTAECVTETDDIGIEIDHLPLDEQKSLIALFTQVTGLEFSSVLTSGGASVHAHLKLSEHFPVHVVTHWRRMAIIAFQSDPVTERLHQPMRLPGFYRKEKGAYQELLSSSDRRYTERELSDGFDLWFEYRGWTVPREISEQWFKEAWFQLFNSLNPASPDLKASQTQKYLAEGNDAYIARREAESEARAAERKPITDVTGEKISDVVQAVCDRASVPDFGGVDWQGQGGHYRGQCPFHSGRTGNSAWLSDKLGGFKFHCVSCTDDQPRSSFEYWVARQGIAGIEDATLKGKDYVKAAEVFLGQYGLVLPKKAETNGHSKPVKTESNGHAPKDEEPSIEERPSIEYFPDELPSVCDQVLGAISNGHDPLSRVYVQGGSAQVLTRILQHRERASVLEILDHETLRNQINKKAKFYVTKKTSKGEYESPIECPGSVSKHILSDSRWPSLSEIKGLSNIPLLQSDGTVLNKKGYDPKSKYLLEINPDDFNILEAPTEVDAFNALEVLDNLISEFEFKGEPDRSATLAMFLTAVSRKMYTTAPLFAVDANRPGVGKGTLVNMATSIISGDKNAGTLITYSPDPEEFRKKVLSVLIDGLPCVNIDNIKEGELGGSTLEKILTDPSGSHKDRMLGASKTISVSTEVLWTANGNNIRLTKDMQRRSIVIKLFSSVANLGDRKFSRTDQQLSEYLEAERPRLVTAAITVLQAFLLANPQQEWPSPLPGFSAWDRLVRGALLWLGQPDPVAVQAEFEAMDESGEDFAFLLESWYALYEDTPILLSSLLKDQGGESFDLGTGASWARKALNEALSPYDRGKEGKRVDANTLSKRLLKYNGMVAKGFILEGLPKGREGKLWVVKKISP